MQRDHLGGIAKAEVDINQDVPGLSAQRVAWRGSWSQDKVYVRGSWSAQCSELPGRIAKTEVHMGQCGVWVLPTKCALSGQVKLKWVQVEMSWGARCRERLGEGNGAEVGMGRHAPGCSTQGCPGGAAGSKADIGQEVPEHSASKVP